MSILNNLDQPRPSLTHLLNERAALRKAAVEKPVAKGVPGTVEVPNCAQLLRSEDVEFEYRGYHCEMSVAREIHPNRQGVYFIEAGVETEPNFFEQFDLLMFIEQSEIDEYWNAMLDSMEEFSDMHSPELCKWIALALDRFLADRFATAQEA